MAVPQQRLKYENMFWMAGDAVAAQTPRIIRRRVRWRSMSWPKLMFCDVFFYKFQFCVFCGLVFDD